MLASRNLTVRIRLLKEDLHLYKNCKKLKPDIYNRLLTDLNICKRLYKEEVSKVNVNNLLTTC